MKKRHQRLLRFLAWIAFIIYLFVMVYFLFFCEQLGRIPGSEYHYNLVPFAEIKRYVNYARQIGSFGVMLNLFGNVVCFIPLGFVLPIISRPRWGFLKVFFSCFFASCAVEAIQLLSKIGSCDVDDIILNSIGGLIGYILFLIGNRIYHKKAKKR